jgi:T-complex protein 1 subunit zeta
MSSLQFINSKADQLKKNNALNMNINASKGLSEVLKTNIGPKGTLKMLVGGAGQIKITKDGNVLLHEMQIQHPTASMIGRASTAQDDQVGDGTTSNVLFCGDLMKLSERRILDGIHPAIIVDGIEAAKKESLKFLDKLNYKPEKVDREFLLNVARTSLKTKVPNELANQLTEIVTDAVITVKRDNNIDLHMVEIMHMNHKMSTETKLIKGLVMDHGGRHPDMPRKLENCYILTLNVSLEYEKTEVNSGFFYSNAEQREKLVASERSFTDETVRKIIALKRKVCDGTDKSFVVINQKGIDPLSLDMLAKENIIALRRAKRRNMERLILACGGRAPHSADDLTIEDLGYADKVYEESLGEDKYTFVEGVKNPFSCTILIKGPNEHSIAQTKDAIRDGLRAVKNTFDDGSVVPGAGAFEISCSEHLKEFAKSGQVKGKAILGVEVFAEALLSIPKAIISNAGQDVQETIINVIMGNKEQNAYLGLDISTGKAINPILAGIFDNYCVKKSFLNIAPVLVQQLLLVDEVIRAGKQMNKNSEGPNY